MIIGITGGIGSGKTVVLNILKNKYNFYVIEADKIGHEILKTGTDAYNNVVKCFGKEILASDGNIDRAKLGDEVFADRIKLEQLNSITHEGVINEIRRIIACEREKNPKISFVVETAVLYESGFDKMCDMVLYVYAEQSERIRRLKETRNLSEKKIRCIMERQLNEEEFRKRADVCIDNSRSVEETEHQLEKLLVI